MPEQIFKYQIIVSAAKFLMIPSQLFFGAYEMLMKLSGNVHYVFSGLAVIDMLKNRERVGYDITEITLRDLSEREMAEYVESGEPLDKAGAYGIQECGGAFVENIKGSFSNVVGLPKELLKQFLAELEIQEFQGRYQQGGGI